MLYLKRFFLLVLVYVILPACGQQSVVHVREFKIYTNTQDPELKETVEQLVNQYNSDMGGEVLVIVDSPEEANSSINFSKGMLSSEHRLGHGQWTTQTENKQAGIIEKSLNSEEVIINYSMHMTFDLDNFRSKAQGRFQAFSTNWRHLYHLFCHEVGHGLQMDHNNQEDDVMFAKISQNSRSDLDYESYFARARTFFTQP